MFAFPFTPDASVPFCTRNVHHKIHRRESCKEEVKSVEVASVEVSGDPPGHVVLGRDLHHHGHEEAAHVVPQRDRGHAESAPEALQPVWRLRVEELKLPHVHENLGRPDEAVLWNLPEDAQRA